MFFPLMDFKWNLHEKHAIYMFFLRRATDIDYKLFKEMMIQTNQK